jgi:hypothetical protein
VVEPVCCESKSASRKPSATGAAIAIVTEVTRESAHRLGISLPASQTGRPSAPDYVPSARHHGALARPWELTNTITGDDRPPVVPPPLSSAW